MNEILPTNYIFNTQNVLTPERTNLNIWNKLHISTILYIVVVVMAVLAVLCFIVSEIYYNKATNSDHKYIHKSQTSYDSGWVLVTLTTLTFLLTLLVNTLSGSYDPVYDLNCDFKLRENSNLIVRQDKDQRPFKSTDSHAYPYRLYVKNTANTNQLIYLGQTNTQKEIFLDDNSKTSELFASYCNYIQKHHLANKFKKVLYFIKDPNVTDINGVPQYILKGDGITLKMKFNKNAPYQIYEERV